jgi:carboxyl-terminal processing protease
MLQRMIFLLLFLISPLVAAPPMLKLSDIHRVFARLFAFHIENKELSPTLIRRSFKVYIEQFDPEKSYLLAKEVLPYLELSDEKAEKIIDRMERQDYSDYVGLHQIFQRAVLRAEAMRSAIAQKLMKLEGFEQEAPRSSMPQYAVSEMELVQRQQARMVRFLSFQKARVSIDSSERKAKAFVLFEKKIRRMESHILFKESSGDFFSQEKREHLLATKILKSFAKSLDTHTSFFSPEEAYEMRLSLEKQFEGVGVVLSENIDGVAIVELIKGSPAEQQGAIRVHDFLVEINGQLIEALTFEEVLDLLKKKEEMHLGFKRVEKNGQENLYHVSLKKRAISMGEERIETSFEKSGDGIIGKITLHSFYENGQGMSSERDIKEAIRSFEQHGKLEGLVLDLRENAGGFLSQAVKVAGLFVSNGVIVISKYGTGELHYLRSLAGRPFFSGPLVILTSKMSASAAEIVAQALQDYGVGVVVGDTRTFGKGSIQYQNVTDPKADLFFKVTVGRYYTVSGRSTQIEGVIADIVVPSHYAPYNIGERFLEYPLSADVVAPAYIDPLTDLDEKTRKLFEKRYLPFLQRNVSYWKKALPQLKQRSAVRLAKNPDFQAFLRKVETVRARQNTLAPNTIDEQIRVGAQDLQMQEAVHIVKDMLWIEEQNRPKEERLAPTGSD